MEFLYIDESGSMTTQYTNSDPYFVIAIVHTDNPDRLRVLYKRFVTKHREELLAADKDSRMFKDGKFKELKGSALTPQLKKKFISYFCRENTLKLFYIVIDNQKINSNTYDNTARAFNYFLKVALSFFLSKKHLPDGKYSIQSDERNERTDTKYFLQNYLNTELRLNNTLSTDLQVKYFDSSKNKLIQVADVFANVCYSQLRTSAYSDEFIQMKESGCLKFFFQFPLK